MKTIRMKLVGSSTSEFLTVYERRRLNDIGNPAFRAWNAFINLLYASCLLLDLHYES
jgi:hypothetical protein